MPPRPRFTKDQIINVAYEIARNEGIEAVVARNVGNKLSSTSSPIFTFFDSMDELKNEVYAKAKECCRSYISDCINYVPAFKAFGLRWTCFAIKEPNLYRMLFSPPRSCKSVATNIKEDFKDIIHPIVNSSMVVFGINEDDAYSLLNQMMIHANGIAASVVSSSSEYSDELVGSLLSEICIGLVFLIKLRHGTFNTAGAEELAKNTALMPKRIHTL